jgi:alanine dehydrogenase
MTSTFALTNATLPYAVRLADLGWKDAVRKDPSLAGGVSTLEGKVTYEAVATAFDLPYTPLAELVR